MIRIKSVLATWTKSREINLTHYSIEQADINYSTEQADINYSTEQADINYSIEQADINYSLLGNHFSLDSRIRFIMQNLIIF